MTADAQGGVGGAGREPTPIPDLLAAFVTRRVCRPRGGCSSGHKAAARIRSAGPLCGRFSPFVEWNYRGLGTPGATAGPPVVPPLSQTLTVFIAPSASVRDV